jgi:fucose 4-O-acetylase-like acetyltransferase
MQYDMALTANKLHLQTFDLLRFPLAFFVVCELVFLGKKLTAQNTVYDINEYPIIRILGDLIDMLLTGANVPLFFIISGFLFFYNVDFNLGIYKSKIWRRVSTLLIPYFIWNTIAILLRLLPLIPYLSSMFPRASSLTYNFSFLNILSCYWTNYPGIIVGTPQYYVPIDGPLYYMRDLMIVVLLSPMIHLLIKKAGASIVYLFGLFWIMEPFVDKALTIPCMVFMTKALFFFSWGAYMSINRINLEEKFQKLFTPSIITYVLTCILWLLSKYYFPEWTLFIHRITILSFIVLAYNIAALCLRKGCKVNKFLVSSSFFIYVSHCLILEYVRKILLVVLHPTNNLMLFVFYILTLAVVVFSLLGVFYLIRRYTPSLLKILTGRS